MSVASTICRFSAKLRRTRRRAPAWPSAPFSSAAFPTPPACRCFDLNSRRPGSDAYLISALCEAALEMPGRDRPAALFVFDDAVMRSLKYFVTRGQSEFFRVKTHAGLAAIYELLVRQRTEEVPDPFVGVIPDTFDMVSAALSHEVQRGRLNGGLVDKYRRKRRNQAVQSLAEMKVDPERVHARMRAVYGIYPGADIERGEHSSSNLRTTS